MAEFLSAVADPAFNIEARLSSLTVAHASAPSDSHLLCLVGVQ
jgi:hypothetical protein